MQSSTERWHRLKTLFETVLSSGFQNRDALLAELCADDTGLRDEVRTLLLAHERRGFVDELADRLGGTATAGGSATMGRYELIEQLGHGGMGVVWKARDPQLDRVVALKVLPPLFGSDDEHRRRLLAEARAAAALDHRAIATVYEIGETAEGELFLAMAHYEGETLEARLARGALPAVEAMRIAGEVAGGLAAAHSRGITHCDLKPANIFLTGSGAVKLLDFGIARVAGVHPTYVAGPQGTFGYMSPEQRRGENVDARTDVWALGVVLYEMLTGERPARDQVASRLRALVPRIEGPRTGRGTKVAVGLARIIERALSAAPEDRYEDGSALGAALQRLMDERVATGAGDRGRIKRLPIPLSRFFGRQREIEEITRLLGRERLITLTGPGGTGKTRLALQAAFARQDAFADGALFVALASVPDPHLVASRIGEVVGMPQRASGSPFDALSSFLRPHRLLLLLDNFEHVVTVAPSVATLVAECEGLTVMVTSRVPLKVAGEQEYPVSPLPHPAPCDLDAARALSSYAATALFVDRALAVCPDVAIGDHADAIVEICARLDGLPLAIELAAARVKLFSPRAMLARLDRRLDLLKTDSGDRPVRHQSLRHAVSWSYDLLTAGEQAVFRRLSVFVGGCSLGDAALLLDAPPGDTGDTLEECAALVDHSLVRREDAADGSPRLTMLETIREFGLERLREAGEATNARRAHAAGFLALAERAEPALTGPDQAAWFDRLELEHDNLRTALSWAVDVGEVDLALRFGKSLWRFWVARSHLREGRERLARLLAMPGAGARTLLRARVLHAAATLAHGSSDFRGACLLAEESLAIAREHGDRTLAALVLNNVAYLKTSICESANGDTLCEEALTLNQEVGDARGISVALQNRAFLKMFGGDYDAACTLFEESLNWRRAIVEPRGAAYIMTNLAWAELRRGAPDRASRLLREARATLERLDDRQLLAFTVMIEGVLNNAVGRPEEAFSCFERSGALYRLVDNNFGVALALTLDAEVALDRGDRQRASRDLEEALPLVRWTGHCGAMATALSARARLAEDEGDRERAREFNNESLDLWMRLGHRHEIGRCQEALARIG
jgi:non-specific serine/threonine protein kinase